MRLAIFNWGFEVDVTRVSTDPLSFLILTNHITAVLTHLKRVLALCILSDKSSTESLEFEVIFPIHAILSIT